MSLIIGKKLRFMVPTGPRGILTGHCGHCGFFSKVLRTGTKR